MPTYEEIYQFFDNRDAYAAFLRRVTVAVVKKASALRAEAPPSPVTAEWLARQNWALQVLSTAAAPGTQAARLLPGLVLLAAEAGYLNDGDLADVTDLQITNALTDAFVDRYGGFTPPLP